jgi:bacteriocin biosynthesis cyclodehydratase domain-containing protein
MTASPQTADEETHETAALAELAGFARPRLRPEVPILWRDQSSIQLGDDVIVDRVTRSHVAWLTSLDGLRSPAEIEDDLALPAGEARRLLRCLLHAGALDDASRIPDGLRWAAPTDRSTVSRRFGAAVDAYRDLDLAHDAMDRRDRCRVAVLGDGSLADLVRAATDASGLATGTVGDASLTILADALHPDVPGQFDHPCLDRPHLPVTTLGGRAVAGPVIVPGDTGCLRCAHLHRRDADPAWPLLAVQWGQALTGLPCPPVDPLLEQLAAAQAVLLARAWVDAPDRRDLWSGFAWELTLPDVQARRVPRPAHPLCGCRWPAA